MYWVRFDTQVSKGISTMRWDETYHAVVPLPYLLNFWTVKPWIGATPISSFFSRFLLSCFSNENTWAKSSDAKWTEHTSEYLVAVHFLRIEFTNATQFRLLLTASGLVSSKYGMGCSEIPSSSFFTLLQPPTTHLWTIFFLTNHSNQSRRNREIEGSRETSVPGMTSQPDYPQVSLCAVFDMTGSKISRFYMAKTQGRKICIEKKIFDLHIRIPVRFNLANKKICHIHFKVEHRTTVYLKYKQNRKYGWNCDLYVVLVVSAKAWLL